MKNACARNILFMSSLFFVLLFASGANEITQKSLVDSKMLAGRTGISIIPKPMKAERLPGFFRINPETTVIADGEPAELAAIAGELAEKLRKATGFPFEHQAAGQKKNVIRLNLTEDKKNLGPEGYVLTVTKNLIHIEAPEPAGLFYGVQSLLQLMPAEVWLSQRINSVDWVIPCVRIEDKPRFRWRGMHLDVCRHFFPKEFVKKYIDLLAMHKMNTFHWHLTEDQGWRIEIKKYPRLTEIGAWRHESMDDGTPHGGFYTQEYIREVVAYAKSRFITIVPEVEMPGHSQAALASYPELSCSGGPFKVGTEWGIIYDVYCAGNEKTFEFLEDVLTEVLELFPSEYIHIGGDEVPKRRWENCVKCQERIKAEGLKDEHELQSYFIRRIEKFLSAKGRRLVGWDEILEGGLAPNATVMSWRGTAGGIEAARSGHDVVMSPTSHCYFDYYQGKHDEPRAIGGFLPVEIVYSLEPVPAELTPKEAKHVLGAQANIWTEYIAAEEHVEYMLLPRMSALSEVVWSDKRHKNFADFSQRLIDHYDRLAARSVNFRVPPPVGLGGRAVIIDKTTLSIENPVPGAEIRYTLDGSNPTRESFLYTQPIEILENRMVKAKTFLRNGRASRTAMTLYSLIDPDVSGLDYAYYEGTWWRLPGFEKLTPVKTGSTYDFSLEKVEPREDFFAVAFNGYIQIDVEGDYTFYTVSDEGSQLFIGETNVVNNDGIHLQKEASGKIRLSKGRHPIKVIYFDHTWNHYLEVYFEGPGFGRQPLPAHCLFRK